MSDTIRCALFDIDGTLVSMQGAGMRAMDHAFEALTGVPRAFRGVPMAGRTDCAILQDALERLAAQGVRLPPAERLVPEFNRRYLERLQLEAAPAGPTVCPGVIPALDELERRGVALGLATGNLAGGADLKLARFGLRNRFAFGGYGDRERDRVRVVEAAAQEAIRLTGAPRDRLLVIGDTEHDIAAGRAIGARTLAVATGPFTREQLAAHGPDLLCGDLREALRREFWRAV